MTLTLPFVLQVLTLVLLILMLWEHRRESKRRDKMLAEQAQRISALIDDIRQREGL